MAHSKRNVSMTDKNIVLFDMDGTLTPPRQQADDTIMESLESLSKVSEIGIVTGSDMNYIRQQMPAVFQESNPFGSKLILLPCNGTKMYKFIKDGEYEAEYSSSMKYEIGKGLYAKIVDMCLAWQREIMRDYHEAPFTGTFIQYRGSMINWCPIGRDAGYAERQYWDMIDRNHDIREKYVKKLSESISQLGGTITIALGGSTSFDIYPDGWNKTYSLKHLEGYTVWFIGDKCEAGENDWHLYEKLRDSGRSFKTTGPSMTIDIINDIKEKLVKPKNLD